MTEKNTIRDLIDRISRQAGITKKMAADILRTLPGIIEAGLKKDGEVKVKGLGTFRLKPVKAKTGRNPRTGARVQIPPHNKIVFMPEKSFKEFINQPRRILEYQILEEKREQPTVKKPAPEPSPTRPEEAPAPQEPQETHAEPVYAPTMLAPEIPLDPPPPAEKPPQGRRKIHWVIPTLLAIIVVLSLIFYMRNCNQAEDRSQKTEVRSQEEDDESQETEVSSQETDVEAEEPVSEEPEAEPEEALTKDSETAELKFNIQPSTFNITEGKYLFRIASETYGNPYLWPLIYKANQEIITDPGLVVIGKEILIPPLEGTRDKLTRYDSLEISEGYRMVYEYYREKGDPKADDFRIAMERYHSN